jgi:hypothetical protein
LKRSSSIAQAHFYRRSKQAPTRLIGSRTRGDVMKRSSLFALGLSALGAALALTACQSGALAPNAPLGAQSTGVGLHQYDGWHRMLTLTPLPSAGCFEASYPLVAWKPVPCATSPDFVIPSPSTRRVRPDVVSTNNSFDAWAPPNRLISSAVGAFPSANPRTVKSVGNPNDPRLGNDSFSLQLNSNTFATVACAELKNCIGWEQFIYTHPNPSYEKTGQALIQDWLIPTYGPTWTKCPRGNWTLETNASGQVAGCVQNGPKTVNVPYQPVTALAAMSVTGIASVNGDGVIFAVGAKMYAAKNAQPGDTTDLVKHWAGSQFNVFGDGGGSIARFNAKTTIVVRLAIDTGVPSHPRCTFEPSFTAETNNLKFVAPPKNTPEIDLPSIYFMESNATGRGNPACDMESATDT